MRDDLHKKAPVPRRVQRVLRLALREADRLHPDRLIVAAQSALDQAMRAGCSTNTLERLAGHVSQGELFGPAIRRASSPMEEEILTGVASHPERPNADALRYGLDTFAESWMREIRATLVADGSVRKIEAIMSAISSAFNMGADNVTRSVCTNETLPRSVAPVQIDENLLPPDWDAQA